ncbi:MAG: glycoside hydrolase [Acidobacteria bacterium]|nr:MAG: glycoside hydrolase [Acidobacteriota bacterium]
MFTLSFSLNVREINSQSYQLVEYMKRVEEFPDYIDGSLVREWITRDRLPEGKLYVDSNELTQRDMEEFLREANLEGIREKGRVLFGFTIKRTNMRMYPSDKTVHKGDSRVDYNQYTLLEPLTPLAILHSSRSGEWLYVHAPFMRGWVKSSLIVPASRDDLRKVKSMPFLMVRVSKVSLGGIEFGLGARVPYYRREGNRYLVMLPGKKKVWVEKGREFQEGYTNFSPELAKEILEGLLGTPYDWGGKEGRWDCSSLVQNLYSLFGLELPRNSAQQALIGRVVSKGFKSYEEFKETLRTLPPFRTLLFMKGHVILYGGMEKGDIVLYHAVNSLNTEDGTRWHIRSIHKNLVERDRIRNIHKAIISVNVLD